MTLKIVVCCLGCGGYLLGNGEKLLHTSEVTRGQHVLKVAEFINHTMLDRAYVCDGQLAVEKDFKLLKIVGRTYEPQPTFLTLYLHEVGT